MALQLTAAGCAVRTLVGAGRGPGKLVGRRLGPAHGARCFARGRS